MSILAKNNNRVLFIENTGVRAPNITDIPRIKRRIDHWLKSTKGFRKEMENIYVYSPIILPFPYLRISRWINKFLLLGSLNKWIKVMEFHDPVIWTFLPTPIVLKLAEDIPHKAFVYYCTDNFSATSKGAKKIIRYEQEVGKKADVVFVMSSTMTEYLSHFNTNVTCVPMGIEVDKFLERGRVAEDLPEMKSLEGVLIGYVGGIRSVIDQELIVYLSKNMPDAKFIFIGPIQTNIEKLINLKNIIFIGQKPHADLKKYLKYFHACIIPYKKDDYADSVSSAKLNEYLIMGKPVISTNLKGIEEFNRENGNVVSIASDYKEFLGHLKKSMLEDNEGLRERRKEAALGNSWECKVEKMSEIIRIAMEAKEKRTEFNWQSRLLLIYREMMKKTFTPVLAAIVIWILVFHTSLFWFFSSPLKISETLRKADAIVVFGGGVGETGSPGKSTIERARYAATLYKRGYSDKILFSSGYTYVYNDAENMKLFAVSMGVPEKDILLEQKANSTYENVIFSKNILNQNNYRAILLISSPYNMKRAKLVFDKSGKDIKVIYAPVDNDQFYDRHKGRRLEQIKAVMHEYLGIIYYWIKGYI
jgi:uncharacterized SAM-binding protein YcdF (DUF218 family)/glycosyltransferase involved in cell wall biosynthesis